MPKLIKGSDVKFLDDKSSLIPLLKKQGWTVEGETEKPEVKKPKKKDEVE